MSQSLRLFLLSGLSGCVAMGQDCPGVSSGPWDICSTPPSWLAMHKARSGCLQPILYTGEDS